MTTAACALVLTSCQDEDPGISDGEQPPDVGHVTSTGAWTELPDSPLSARYQPVSLWDGTKFYIVGGLAGSPCPPNADCALPETDPLRDGAAFDLQSGSWQRIAPAPLPITGQAVAVGQTLYFLTYPVGSDGSEFFLSYDIARDRWTQLPAPKPRGGWLSRTSDAPVVFDEAHGRNFVLDTLASQWRRLPTSPSGPGVGGYPVWVDGQLLMATHADVPNDEAPIVQLASYDATLDAWTELGDSEIVGFGPVAVGDLAVWPSPESLDGGEVDNWGHAYDEGGIYDPSTQSWTDLPPQPAKLGGIPGTVTTDHLVSIYGNLLNPATGNWTSVPQPPGGDRYAAASVGGADSVLVWGGTVLGENDGESLDTGYLLTVEP